MNERFSKLLQECIVSADLAVDYSKTKGLTIPDEKLDVAKFAELIVRQCLSIVDDAERGGSNEVWDNAVEFIRRDLKEHFGVEE